DIEGANDQRQLLRGVGRREQCDTAADQWAAPGDLGAAPVEVEVERDLNIRGRCGDPRRCGLRRAGVGGGADRGLLSVRYGPDSVSRLRRVLLVLVSGAGQFNTL